MESRTAIGLQMFNPFLESEKAVRDRRKRQRRRSLIKSDAAKSLNKGQSARDALRDPVR
jgi:hypothetical protein